MRRPVDKIDPNGARTHPKKKKKNWNPRFTLLCKTGPSVHVTQGLDRPMNVTLKIAKWWKYAPTHTHVGSEKTPGTGHLCVSPIALFPKIHHPGPISHLTFPHSKIKTLRQIFPLVTGSREEALIEVLPFERFRGLGPPQRPVYVAGKYQLWYQRLSTI